MSSNTQTITITKDALKDGVVIMNLRSYKKLVTSRVPTIQLHGKAAEKHDKEVKKALAEYHSGKTKEIKSLADLE